MRLPLVLAVAIFCSRCAQAPDKELDLTASRVAKAKEAGAAIYAPDLLDEAEQALKSARERLGQRDYRSAIRAAALSAVRADEAHDIAVEKRRRPTADAERLILEVTALIEEARSRGATALSEYEARLGAERALLETGRPEESRQRGVALKADLLALHRSLAPKNP